MSTLSKTKEEFEEKFDLYSVSFWDGKYPNAYKEGKTKLWSFIASSLKKQEAQTRKEVFNKLRTLGTNTWMSDVRFGKDYEKGIFIPEAIIERYFPLLAL